MVKKTVSADPEYQARLEAYRNTRHDSLTFEGRVYAKDDEVYVQLPNDSQGTKATFKCYVMPLKGRAYVEVVTRDGVNRAVRPESIIRGGKKVV